MPLNMLCRYHHSTYTKINCKYRFNRTHAQTNLYISILTHRSTEQNSTQSTENEMKEYTETYNEMIFLLFRKKNNKIKPTQFSYCQTLLS